MGVTANTLIKRSLAKLAGQESVSSVGLGSPFQPTLFCGGGLLLLDLVQQGPGVLVYRFRLQPRRT